MFDNTIKPCRANYKSEVAWFCLDIYPKIVTTCTFLVSRNGAAAWSFWAPWRVPVWRYGVVIVKQEQSKKLTTFW